jgi:hypothetical protein
VPVYVYRWPGRRATAFRGDDRARPRFERRALGVGYLLLNMHRVAEDA